MQTIHDLYTKNNKIFGELKYTPDIFSDYTKHFHTHFGLALIEHGDLHITYDLDNVQYLDNHSLAIFNPKQIHCSKAYKAKGYYVLFLDTQWCEQLQKDFYFENSILPNKILYREFYTLFQKILYTKNIDIEKDIKIIIKNLFKSYAKVSQNKESQRILKIKALIESPNASSLSVDKIAKHIGYNKSYFIRFFKKEVGLTPQQYILNVKINHAKNLLTYTKKDSLSTISLEAGFFDQSHFNRNFKSLFGTTPKRYKKVNIVQDK